jgi:DMSO reductase anchor subunit
MIAHMELPLVIFTVLSQMAIGMALLSTARQWNIVDGPSVRTRIEWVTIGLLLALSIVASFFHLGHPLGAVRMLANLGSAWLSREILGLGLFGILVALIFLAEWTGKMNRWLLILAAVVGLLALFATAMTYATPPSFEAINNALPLVFFGLTTVILGAAVSSYFAGAAWQPLLVSVLKTALIVSLVVNLLIPNMWLSGGTIMRQTGEAYLSSPLYWGQIVVGLLAPLLILWRMRRIPVWLPILLIAGEVLGRIAFFALNASSAGNLGNLY